MILREGIVMKKDDKSCERTKDYEESLLEALF